MASVAFEPQNSAGVSQWYILLRLLYALQAVAAATALVESKLNSELKKFLKKNIVKKELTDELAVSDSKLGGVIKDKLDIPVRQTRE
jgi:hypothetical protein